MHMTLNIIKDGEEIISREESMEYEKKELALLLCVILGLDDSDLDINIEIQTKK
ncbi:MAG: hypothetical protein K2J82_07810 [Muribaculaceae bacterium]|nr:hypothetical protein [Muribaculaceae bacterium]